jgi:hypothetical protein
MKLAIAMCSMVFLTACSTPEPSRVCTPGASNACTCADGRAGAQVCTADGSGFAACACAGIDAGMRTDAPIVGTDSGGPGPCDITPGTYSRVWATPTGSDPMCTEAGLPTSNATVASLDEYTGAEAASCPTGATCDFVVAEPPDCESFSNTVVSADTSVRTWATRVSATSFNVELSLTNARGDCFATGVATYVGP